MTRGLALVLVALFVLPASLAGAWLPCNGAAMECQMACCGSESSGCHESAMSVMAGPGC